MKMHDLILGGVRIGLDSSHRLSQTYETLGGRSLRRMMSGAAHLQVAWSKLRTVISGEGDLPAGLDALDYTAALTLDCAAPMDIWSATTTIVLPAGRRSDVAPLAYALVNGQHRRTAYTLSTDTATLTAVSGAQGYVMAYYPTLTVHASPPGKTFDARGIMVSWSLVAEEA